MEKFKEILQLIPDIIDLIGAAILLIGFIRGLFEFSKMEFNRLSNKGSWFRVMQIVRCDLGLYILLSLDFIITSDIINSMIHIDFDDLMNLGVIVILRAVIGYFLGKEVEEAHTHVKKDRKASNDNE